MFFVDVVFVYLNPCETAPAYIIASPEEILDYLKLHKSKLLQSETLHYLNSHQLPVQGYVYGVKVSCFPDKEPKKVFVSKENNTKGRLDKVTHLKR